MRCRKESTVQIILFEKYRVDTVVYESDNATVYMVEHIQMQTRRIIKKILKKSIHRSSFYSEINILKTIKHPNIPIIYDQYEDEEAFYIVEEYIEAPNLMEYIKENGVIDECKAVDIGIKLCEIISFLHSQKPIPILFLDIQPKNILIQGNKIYLVDFGNSYYLNEVKNRNVLLGTPGYAAPEQYKYESLDERTDIYGIGAVLYFMVTGRSGNHKSANSLEFPSEITGKYKMIVRQCLSEEITSRFHSVNTIGDNLYELTNNDIKYSKEDKPLIISLVGTKTNCGVTSIGLTLANYLSRDNKVIYEECNDSNHIRSLAQYYKLNYGGGYFSKNGNFLLKPDYGPQIMLRQSCKYIVKDYGNNLILEEVGDVLIVVAQISPWDILSTVKQCRQYMDWFREHSETKVIVIANSVNEKLCMKLWNSLGIIGINMPNIDDVFVMDKLVESQIQELYVAMNITGQGGEENKKKTGLFRRISKTK